MIHLPFAARVAALFTRPCHSCASRVGLRTALCEACISRLPTVPMWAYREAHDERLRNPKRHQDELERAVDWLAANPKRRDAATTTTAKESSQ